MTPAQSSDPPPHPLIRFSLDHPGWLIRVTALIMLVLALLAALPSIWPQAFAPLAALEVDTDPENMLPETARGNVAHHYDLDERLFRLFLDPDMQYSCAYYEYGNETLEEAQRKKKRHIAAKMWLAPGQRVLDIGCGWGGMGLYLAQVAGAEVTGVTLAEEQLRVARQRAEAAGLADRVKFLLADYRKVEGTFDRVVSVGMFEHVGSAHRHRHRP